MSPDPIYDGLKDGLGVYTYCRNNPLKYVDPTGLWGETKEQQDYIKQQRNKARARKATQDSLKKALEKIKQNNERTLPMNEAKIIADFEEHKGWKSPSPGIDMTSEDERVYVMHDGILVYKDSGDKGYGFHAELTYEGENGEEIKENYGHKKRPKNYKELIEKDPISVKKGDLIGDMSNTGDVWTKQDNGEYGPVTKKQREEGRGTHLHWDKKVRKEGQKSFKYVDPLQ